MLKRSSGFTMIEIMIVTAIIAASVVMALPYITNRNAQTRAFLREITVMSRELHIKAKLHGVVYRMVIDFPERRSSGDSEVQKIWVEKGNSGMVIPKEDADSVAAVVAAKGEEPAPRDPKGFEADGSIKPRELPVGMRIDRVELTRMKDAVSSGKVYIHYLPQGLVDEAAIHIKGAADQAWTIAIHPLTGKAEIIQKPISLKEIKSQ